jgi:phosphoenolpyruvate carboxykinase (GTP)
MADYWQHWLDMEKKLTNPPKIFNVNWFRTDEQGNFLWPGFGDNLRVLEWIMKRCFDKIDAQESPIGYLPKAEDIDLTGLDEVSRETLQGLLTVDKDLWREEAAGIRTFYAKFGDKLPQSLQDSLDTLEKNLG